MTTMTVLTQAHRCALNIAYTNAERGAHPNHLLGHPDIDLDTIYEMVEAGYLIGPTREELRAGTLPGELHYHFHLTPRGRFWAERDPVSCLLRDLLQRLRTALATDQSGRTAVRLRDALRRHDWSTIRKAHEAGYLTVHYAGDGRECRVLGDYEFGHAKDFSVCITSKARDYAIG